MIIPFNGFERDALLQKGIEALFTNELIEEGKAKKNGREKKTESEKHDHFLVKG